MVKKSAGPRFCAWECTEAVGTQSVMNYDSRHGWCNYDLKAKEKEKESWSTRSTHTNSL